MDRLFVKRGAHENLSDGACIMELCAWVAGETHSDSPACVSPVIAAFMRRLNDRLDDEKRQQLVPYAISCIGTNTGRTDDIVRAYLCADWACRTVAPWWLERAGLHDYATRLRALPGVIDRATADVARAVCREARYAAAAYAYADAYAAADADAYADASADASAALLPSALALVDRMIAVGRKDDTPMIEERREVVASCAVSR